MLVTKTLTKKTLELLIQNTFASFGNIPTVNLLDSVKFLGFYYATASGLSISIDDLKTPYEKSQILKQTEEKILNINENWFQGKISESERFETIITSWNEATESLKTRIVEYYKEFDPCNSLYIMAFSGARGNISQIRQLIGMRGLMSDQAGNIINLPITSNFQEGLSPIDYIVSSYGARKGIVDTALKTADSGYLTRRLVYSARNVLIKHYDCKTDNGLFIFVTEKKTYHNLLGKILISENLFDFSNCGKLIDEKFFAFLKHKNLNKPSTIFLKKKFLLKVRSPITCQYQKSICQTCYGWDLSKRKLISIGEAVGVIAAQSIGEPGTQLTMRTFHTGGIFSGELVNQNRAIFSGKLFLPKEFKSAPYRTTEGKIVLKILQDISAELIHWTGKKKYMFLEIGTYIFFNNSQYVRKNQIISELTKKNISSIEFKTKPIYSFFEGQMITETNLSLFKEGIFWLQSGKNYTLPFDISYNHPKILNNKKRFGFVKFISSIEGLIKKKNSLTIQNLPLNIYIKKFQIVKKCIGFFYKCLYSTSLLKIEDQKKQFFYYRSKYKKFPTNWGKKFKKIQIKLDILKKYFIAIYLGLEGDISTFSAIPKLAEIMENNDSLIKLPFDSSLKKNKNLNQKSAILVKNIQYIDPHTCLGKIFFYPINLGKIYDLKIKISKIENTVHFFFITQEDIWKYHSDQISQTFLFSDLKEKIFFKRGSYFNPISKSLNSGIFLKKDGFRFLFQSAKPIFMPISSKINFKENDFIQNNMLLGTLVTSSQQTEDIVQGLPKIEELFEARSEQEIAFTANFRGIFLKYERIKKIKFLQNKRFNELKYQNIIVNENNYFNKEESKKDKNENIFESLTSLKEIFFFKKVLYTLTLLNLKKSDTINLKKKIIKKKLYFYKQTGKIGFKQVFQDSYTGFIYILTPINNILGFSLKYTVPIKKPSINQPSACSNLKSKGEFVDLLEQLDYGKLNARELINNLSFFYRRRLGVRIGNIKAVQQFQLILINSIQSIYYSQGVSISSKHLEIIVREMVSRGRIINEGNTPFFRTETVSLGLLSGICKRLESSDTDFKNIQCPSYIPILESITNAALRKEGFLSNSAFQQTKQLLVKSALYGKTDWLNGLKDSIIVGRLIPSGSIFLNSKLYLDTIFKIKKKSKLKKKFALNLNSIITKEIQKLEILHNKLNEQN